MRDPDGPPETAQTSGFGRLRRRSDFKQVAKGRRWHAAALTMQMVPREGECVNFGFTLTRKVGNAVVRNRARRRLKEAVRMSPDLPARPGHDYVVIGRIEAIRMPFDRLKSELDAAIRGVHESRPKRTRPAS